jgi:chromosome partitioning protein
MEVIAVSNQKGGVGKTVVAVHKAMFLAEKGFKVLFLDFDHQGNASDSLVNVSEVSSIVASEFFNTEIQPIRADQGVTLVKADNAMVDIDRADSSIFPALRKNIEQISSEFDFCIIDTPPTLGYRMTAALIVADYVLSPIELEQYSIKGIAKMLNTIFGVRDQWNPSLKFLGMLPNRFNSRSMAQVATLERLEKEYSHLMIDAKIGLRSSIPEALSEGVPVWKLRKTAAREAGKEFKEAFEIVLEKIKGVK